MAINNQKNVDVHLNPKHAGLLHEEMHVAGDKKIGASKLHHELAIAKKEGNVPLEKRVLFALKFGHKK